MPVKARGASRLKTIAQLRGSGVHSNERHAHQFQIASLELERTRRMHERDTAQSRIKIIEARLDEIDAAIRKHHEALYGAGRGGPAAEPAVEPLHEPAAGPRPAAGEKRRALRY